MGYWLSFRSIKWRAGNTPLKAKFHLHDGFDLTSHIHNTSLNGIVVVRYTDEANNYDLYDESFEILKERFGDKIIPTYSNFKESALLSGTGHREKNSLVYNRKFGFQSKICVFMFVDEIVNHENLKPSKDLLDLCTDCDDCIRIVLWEQFKKIGLMLESAMTFWGLEIIQQYLQLSGFGMKR